jgi:hypothetical protein
MTNGDSNHHLRRASDRGDKHAANVDRARVRDLDRLRKLNQQTARDRYLVDSGFDSIPMRPGDLVRDRDLLDSLARQSRNDHERAIQKARAQAADQADRVRAREHNAAVQAQCAAAGVAPSATHLLTAATFFLPPAHRARYVKEYRAELFDLAASGKRSRSQLLYAVRQIVSSPRVRTELRAPRPRKASP